MFRALLKYCYNANQNRKRIFLYKKKYYCYHKQKKNYLTKNLAKVINFVIQANFCNCFKKKNNLIKIFLIIIKKLYLITLL